LFPYTTLFRSRTVPSAMLYRSASSLSVTGVVSNSLRMASQFTVVTSPHLPVIISPYCFMKEKTPLYSCIYDLGRQRLKIKYFLARDAPRGRGETAGPRACL